MRRRGVDAHSHSELLAGDAGAATVNLPVAGSHAMANVSLQMPANLLAYQQLAQNPQLITGTLPGTVPVGLDQMGLKIHPQQAQPHLQQQQSPPQPSSSQQHMGANEEQEKLEQRRARRCGTPSHPPVSSTRFQASTLNRAIQCDAATSRTTSLQYCGNAAGC